MQPKISSTGNTLRVQHRELVSSSLATASSWTIQQQWNLNPGDPSSFPWLAGIAQHYEYYRLLQFRVIYVPRVATSSAGSVAMAIDYDSAESPPVSEQVMSSYQSFVDGPLWSELICRADPRYCHLNMPYKFVRNFNAEISSEINTFDCGKIYISTADASAVIPAGKIYFEYEFEFKAPSFPADGAPVQSSGQIQGASGSYGVNECFGYAPNPVTGPDIMTHTTANSMNILHLPIGVQYFRLSFYVSGTGLSSATWNNVNGPSNVYYGYCTFANQTFVATATEIMLDTLVTNPTPDKPTAIYVAVVGTTRTYGELRWSSIPEPDV